jgi:hypothetical protein
MPKKDIYALELEGELRIIRTQADHTTSVTFNLPEYCNDQAAQLLKWGTGTFVGIVVSLKEFNYERTGPSGPQSTE